MIEIEYITWRKGYLLASWAKLVLLQKWTLIINLEGQQYFF